MAQDGAHNDDTCRQGGKRSSSGLSLAAYDAVAVSLLSDKVKIALHRVSKNVVDLRNVL